MNMHVIVSRPVYYGLLYAAMYGLATFLFSFLAIYLMIRPDVDFVYAWKSVIDVTASGIIAFNILGFWSGWSRANSDEY